MKFIRNLMDKQAPHFEKGGKLEVLYPLFEAIESFHFTPGTVTKGAPHVRDAADMKRVMFTVVISLVPAILMGVWILGEPFTVWVAAGTVLVMTGIFIFTRMARRP